LTRNRQLDGAKIIDTVTLLKLRILERFPGSGLGRVASELEEIAKQAQIRCERICRPNLPLRFFLFLVIMSLLSLVLGALARVDVEEWRHTMDDVVEFVQFVEAGLGALVFLGAAILFLITLENRIKRKRALDALYELRSIVHIIDMHQLTKDPESLSRTGERTRHSPQRTLTPFLLGRYLDYCSEMLSLTSKIGVLYGQGISDAEVLNAIDQIESLSNSLARKIWQKIMILDRYMETEHRTPTRTPPEPAPSDANGAC
jgi:hypothetical protein